MMVKQAEGIPIGQFYLSNVDNRPSLACLIACTDDIHISSPSSRFHHFGIFIVCDYTT